MRHSRSKAPASIGSILLVALLMIFVCTIALASWGVLTATRLTQTQNISNACLRHLAWSNSEAINQQYTYVDGFQTSLTESAATTTIGSGLGGVTEAAYSSLGAFNSTQQSSTSSYNYAFNNICVIPNSLGPPYVASYSGTSDSTQTEHFYLFNYLKTYPWPLMGNLFIVHKRNSAATTGASFDTNFLVNGKVVIMDSTAVTSGIAAQSCFNNVITGANTTLNTAESASVLPDNYPHMPYTSVGYGGTSSPTAITDGSLNVIDNSNFAANSLKAIVVATGSYTTYSSTSTQGTGTSPVQITAPSSLTYTPPTTSPYGYTATKPYSVIQVNLTNSSLTHCVITANFTQVILQGSTTAAQYTAGSSMSPVVIMLENATTRDIRLVGENSRPLILSTGQGTGQTIYMGFMGPSSLTGTNIRWYMHLINQYCSLWMSPPTSYNIALTGSIRTDWSVCCTDTTTANRLVLSADTTTNLLSLLPRDGWNEVYLYNH